MSNNGDRGNGDFCSKWVGGLLKGCLLSIDCDYKALLMMYGIDQGAHMPPLTRPVHHSPRTGVAAVRPQLSISCMRGW